MRLLKDNNVFKLLVFIFFIIIFTGCKNYTYDEKFIIKDKDIFKQVEEEYYVYFYKDNCKYCNDCFEIVNNYLNSENDIKLYVCNITHSGIARLYDGENGQGTSGTHFVNGVTEYRYLYISGAPSLIKIENQVSTFITSGRSSVKEYFNNIHNHNFIDGVCDCGEKEEYNVIFYNDNNEIIKQEKVKHGSSVTPPFVFKDTYYLVSWDKDLCNITSDLEVRPIFDTKLNYDYKGLPILTEEGELYIRTLYFETSDYYSDLESVHIYKYAGNYNGAEVVNISRGGVDVPRYDYVADYMFYGSHGGDYYEVLYDNKIYRLNEAYELGILTYENIKEIYRVNALLRAYQNTYLMDEYFYKEVLTVYGEERLKQRFYNSYYKDLTTYEDLYIKRFIDGFWENDIYYYACILDYNGSNYEKGNYSETISGYTFEYDDNNTMKLISSNNEVYSLKEAYNLGLVSYKYVDYLYNSFNDEYTVDFILEQQKYVTEQKPQHMDRIKQRYLEIFYPDSEYSIEDLEIVEMYCASSYGLNVVKIINTKDIKEEKLYTVELDGYTFINDENNPILYFTYPYNNSIFSKAKKVEDAYNEGFIERTVLEIIQFTQENIYYKDK